MANRNRLSLAALILGFCLVSGLQAQGTPVEVKEEKPGMLKLVKVEPAEAIKTAQARFPGATLKSAELEKEHGKLIYSFDLQLPGVKGIEEVNIDASTGAVVATEHENPTPPKKPAPKSVTKPSTA